MPRPNRKEETGSTMVADETKPIPKLVDASGEPLDPKTQAIVGGPNGPKTIRSENWKGPYCGGNDQPSQDDAA